MARGTVGRRHLFGDADPLQLAHLKAALRFPADLFIETRTFWKQRQTSGPSHIGT